MSWLELIIISTAICGACGTYAVQHYFNVSAVKASAGLSLIVALMFFVWKTDIPLIYNLHVPAVFFGASFVGMSSKNVLNRLWHIALAGLFFGWIYLNTSTFFEGYGGALGTTACISVVLSYGLQLIVSRFRKKEHLVKEDTSSYNSR